MPLIGEKGASSGRSGCGQERIGDVVLTAETGRVSRQDRRKAGIPLAEHTDPATATGAPTTTTEVLAALTAAEPHGATADQVARTIGLGLDGGWCRTRWRSWPRAVSSIGAGSAVAPCTHSLRRRDAEHGGRFLSPLGRVSSLVAPIGACGQEIVAGCSLRARAHRSVSGVKIARLVSLWLAPPRSVVTGDSGSGRAGRCCSARPRWLSCARSR